MYRERFKYFGQCKRVWETIYFRFESKLHLAIFEVFEYIDFQENLSLSTDYQTIYVHA
jgi:hypothetical protein